MQPVEPRLGAESFSCPHCGALAHQSWRQLGLLDFKNKEHPIKLTYDEAAKVTASGDDAKRWKGFLERLKKNSLTYWHMHYQTTDWVFVNLCLSECYACQGFAIWVEDRIVYPVKDVFIAANGSMPASIKGDFEEAAAIINRSPRGSAALLRLCVQKLMIELGEPGDNLNADIASQVRKGLDAEVQQALDVVRVIGNNAIHPGQIDLKDDKATALALFDLVNMIVERRIATPERLKTLFANLPTTALQQIERRDSKKGDE